MDQQATDVYDQLKGLLNGQKLTTDNVVIIALNLLRIVQTMVSITSDQRKNLIVSTMLSFVDKEMSDHNQAELVKSIITLTLPSVIDATIAGELFLKKEVQSCMSWFSKKCHCC